MAERKGRPGTLEWNVWVCDPNSGTIRLVDLFHHSGLMNDLRRSARQHTDDERVEFEEEMRSSVMRWYWSKAEWEVVVSHWPPNDRYDSRKVDVYEQVWANWHAFTEYVWSRRAVLRSRGKRAGEG